MVQSPPGTDPFTIPFMPRPDGGLSDFTKRSELLTTTIVVCSLMLSLQVVFVGLRVFVRWGSDHQWRTDDWCSVVTLVFTTALGGILIAGCQKIGRHAWDVSLGFYLSAWSQRMLTVIGTLTLCSVFLGKLCLLFLYQRIFGHITKVRYQIYIALFMTLPIIAGIVAFLAIETPASGISQRTLKEHQIRKLSLAIGVVNLLVDLLVLYIPIPVIVKMDLSREKKAGVLIIFLTGLIAVIADMTNLYFWGHFNRDVDPLRNGYIVALCGFVEASISVLCSSMPSVSKFCRVTVRSSTVFMYLRIPFFSTSTKQASLKELTNNDPKKRSQEPRVRGPYSIPGIGFSRAHGSHMGTNRDDEELDLTVLPEGYEQGMPEVSATGQQEFVAPGYIARRVSFEQTSMSFNEPWNHVTESEKQEV